MNIQLKEGVVLIIIDSYNKSFYLNSVQTKEKWKRES